MEKIRVLQVVGRMDIGGTETMLMNLYRNIDREKIQFDFIVHNEDKNFYNDEIEKLGGRIYRVPRFKVINIMQYIRAWDKFFSTHNEYKIIHGHIGSSAAIYLKLANKYGYYTIAHSHSTKSKIKNFKDLAYRIFSFPVRNIAKQFFACGKQAGLDRYGEKVANSQNFKVLNNAIDSKKFIFNENTNRVKRKELNIENKFVVGHVGRFTYPKNHKFIIEVFKKIYEKDNNSVLLLVGDGELRSEIEKEVSNLGLDDVVIFVGMQSNIQDFMNVMDVLLFPSHFEGLPLTIIEAQANGLKCILSNCITTEVNITGNVKYVSLSKNADEWCDKVLEYKIGYERQNMYTKICKSGYDVKESAKWLEKFYSGIINN